MRRASGLMSAFDGDRFLFFGAVGQHVDAAARDGSRADGDHVGRLDHRRDLLGDLAQEFGTLAVVVPVFLVEADDDAFFHLGEHREQVVLVGFERAVDDEQDEVGIFGGGGRFGGPRFATDLGEARRVDEHDRVAGRPGDFAAGDGRAADDVGAKHVAAGERVQERRLAAGDRAEGDDFEALLLALGFELGDGGFDLAAQLRRDAFAVAYSLPAARLSPSSRARSPDDISLGLRLRRLTVGRFLPRVFPDAHQDADREAEQHERARADGGEIEVAGPGAELGGRLVMFEHLGRQREEQVADHRQRDDGEQPVGVSRTGHVFDYRPLSRATPLRRGGHWVQRYRQGDGDERQGIRRAQPSGDSCYSSFSLSPCLPLSLSLPIFREELLAMKAAYINQPGPPESIIVGELPTPQPTGSQVLVKMAATAVNPIDTYVRSGMVAMPLPKPFVVGCDLAGVVEALGPDAKRFKVGDRVWCSCQGVLGRQGTFAEYSAVDESFLFPIPKGVSDETAAACALVSAHRALGPDARRRFEGGRDAVRQRRHGRHRLDGRADVEGDRGSRRHDRRQRREAGQGRASWVRTWPSITRRTMCRRG